MSHQLTLTISDELYQHLAETALTTELTLDQVAVQSLRVGSPPNLNGVPIQYHDDLNSLSRLSDEQLWALTHTKFPPARFATLEELLEKNAEGTLTKREREQLSLLQSESNFLMMRRAYVFSLLRWRGHRVPQITN